MILALTNREAVGNLGRTGLLACRMSVERLSGSLSERPGRERLNRLVCLRHRKGSAKEPEN